MCCSASAHYAALSVQHAAGIGLGKLLIYVVYTPCIGCDGKVCSRFSILLPLPLPCAVQGVGHVEAHWRADLQA
jgi:hypothetical protein